LQNNHYASADGFRFEPCRTPDKVPNGLLSEPRRTARGTKNEEERQKGEKPYWGHQRVEELAAETDSLRRMRISRPQIRNVIGWNLAP
jgi:hypothetical protein